MSASATAHVPTAHAGKYLQQLCKHWQHNLTVEFTPDHGTVVFPKDARGADWPGDALVTIHIRRNQRYRIEGRDLHADLPVPLRDAVLGAKVPVDTIGGRVALKVPEWSSSDRVLRVKGRGLPNKTGERGDLYVHVRIMLPEGNDPELEALMKSRGA